MSQLSVDKIHSKPAQSSSSLSSHVNIDLRLGSKYCSVSGEPLCDLSITFRAVGKRLISLNRQRPLIDFCRAKDGNASIGVPLLSFCRADDPSNKPIFSYQVDVCFQDDRENLFHGGYNGDPGNFITIGEQGYTATNCINLPWDYISAYYQISKLEVGKKYKFSVGRFSETEGAGDRHHKPEVYKLEHLPLIVDPASTNLVELVE